MAGWGTLMAHYARLVGYHFSKIRSRSVWPGSLSKAEIARRWYAGVPASPHVILLVDDGAGPSLYVQIDEPDFHRLPDNGRVDSLEGWVWGRRVDIEGRSALIITTPAPARRRRW